MPGKQQYGKEMFTNLEEILGHFDLNYGLCRANI